MKKKRTKKSATVIVNWLGPIILQQSVINGNLHLTLKDPKLGTVYKVIISKNGNNNYRYEDVGLFTRYFSELDYLIWEFELPKHLKNTIEKLPIVKVDEVKTQNNLSQLLELNVMG